MESVLRAIEYAEIPVGEDGKLVDVLVIPDGNVEGGKKPFFVDQSAFDKINAAFKKRGHAIVFDFEHQTLQGQYAREDGKAPAAGWIHSLKYVPGKGIIARVEWNEEARRAIKAGEYRFMSPVLILDKAEKKPIELHSVGLTNDPAIHNLPRVAAKRGVPDMSKKRDVKIAVLKADTTKFFKALSDLVGSTVSVNAEHPEAELDATVDEGQAEVMEAVTEAVRDLRAALIASGKLGEDATLMDAIKAATEMATDLGDAGEGEGEGEEVVNDSFKAEVAGLVGLRKNATAKSITDALGAMKVGKVDATAYKALQEQVDELRASKAEEAADKAIEAYVASGQLNPNDEQQREWAKTAARTDLKSFKALMDKAPELWNPKTYVAADTAVSNRQRVIDKTKRAFKSNPETYGDVEVEHAIDAELSGAGMDRLNKRELVALK